MPNDNLFDPISGPIEEAISKALKSGRIDEGSSLEFVESLIDKSSRDLASSFVETSPRMLSENREMIQGFVDRCYSRWKEPIDLLRIIWEVCKELAEAHSHNGPIGIDPVTFNVLAHLQPKALLIANEILWLLEGGYADAALSRWRTLHEVTITAMFIAKHDPLTARDYQYQEIFTSRRNARNLSLHSHRAGIQGFSEDELNEMDQACDLVEGIIGRTLAGDFDWAAVALKRSDSRVNFAAIEKDVGMDHWGPRYRWACQHTHAGFWGPHKLLGMSEAKNPMFLVGPSNSGFVDPLHMTAISLHQITATFLLSGEPDSGRTVYTKVIGHLAEILGPLAMKVEQETLEGVE